MTLLGLHDTALTTVNGTYTEYEIELDNYKIKNPNDESLSYLYNSNGECVGWEVAMPGFSDDEMFGL